MKYQTTFHELSKIFAIVAKIDTKIENYVRASGEYTEASEAYYYSLNLAEGKEPRIASEKMCAAYDAREKARKAMHATFKEFIVAVGLWSSDEYEAQELRKAAKRDYDPRAFQYMAQKEAIRLSKLVKL